MCITSILGFAYAVVIEKNVRGCEWAQTTVSHCLIRKYVFLLFFTFIFWVPY